MLSRMMCRAYAPELSNLWGCKGIEGKIDREHWQVMVNFVDDIDSYVGSETQETSLTCATISQRRTVRRKLKTIKRLNERRWAALSAESLGLCMATCVSSSHQSASQFLLHCGSARGPQKGSKWIRQMQVSGRRFLPLFFFLRRYCVGAGYPQIDQPGSQRSVDLQSQSHCLRLQSYTHLPG